MPPTPSTLVMFFGLTIFNWVLLPALALLIETVPFLRETNSPARSEASKRKPKARGLRSEV